MGSNSRVSIIVPVYNVKPYLTEALDSILNQTYSDIEVIIINDGSTDGSAEICAAYAEQDHRIRLIHQENKGLSSARNAGLDVMTGDIVAFLDSDDAYDPDYLKLMVRAMICEQADLVICKYTNHYTNEQMILTGDEKALPQAPEGGYNRTQALYAYLEGSINPAVWNKIYKRHLWEQVRFPDGHVYEDLVTTYKVFDRCKKVYILNSPLYLYRKRPESITSTHTWKNRRDKLMAYSHFIEYVECKTPTVFSNKQLQRVRQRYIEGMIRFYFRYSGRGQNSEGSFTHDLRKTIMKEVRNAGIETIGLRYRTIYCIICACPSMLKFIYPLFRFKKVIAQFRT